MTLWNAIRPSTRNLRIWQVGVLVVLFVFWYVMTKPGLVPPIFFSNDNDAKFFFGEPVRILARIWDWFVADRDIYGHLWVTLVETVLAFAIGTAGGLVVGMWLALSPLAAAILDPYIKAANSMPRVILAPIFAVWFGLGIASKVALGFTLVFFIVFFNVYQGVREVSPTVLANARMLGATAAPCVPAERDQLGVLFAAHLGGAGIRRRSGRRVSGLGARGRLSDLAGRGDVRYQYRHGRDPRADRLCAGPR